MTVWVLTDRRYLGQRMPAALIEWLDGEGCPPRSSWPTTARACAPSRRSRVAVPSRVGAAASRATSCVTRSRDTFALALLEEAEARGAQDARRRAGRPPRAPQGDVRARARPPRAARSRRRCWPAGPTTSAACPSPRSRSSSSPSWATTPRACGSWPSAPSSTLVAVGRPAADRAGLRRGRRLRHQALRRRRRGLGDAPPGAAERPRGPGRSASRSRPRCSAIAEGCRQEFGLTPLRRRRPRVRGPPGHRGRQRVPELHRRRGGARRDRRARPRRGRARAGHHPERMSL